MITKMKKLTFLVYHREYDEFLQNIRDLGVVHIAEKQQGIVDDTALQEKMQLSARLANVLQQLKALNQKDASTEGTAARGLQALQDVDDLQNETARLNQQLQAYAKDEIALRPWGDYEPQSIRKLQEAGLEVGFYICQERSYDEEWEKLYNIFIISREASKVYFIVVSKKGETVDMDAEYVKPSSLSLTETGKAIRETQAAIEQNDRKIAEIAAKEITSVTMAIGDLHRDIEFSQVLLNTEPTADEKLMLLEGWVPVTKEAELVKFLENNHAYFDIKHPTPEDEVPIQFSNKGFFAWFEPICKLYMLPKYGELDLTPFFAPFFMIFFGLCLGDIGYGLFLFLAVTGYRLFVKNISATMKPILSLVQVLSFSTIICGLLTGGFFGFALYDLDWPIAQRLKNMVALDNNQMFQLSLVFGVVQILFGMILKVVNQTIQFGFRYAIATLGWVLLFVSVLVAYLIPSLMPMGGTLHLMVMGVAALMIFLFNSPGKNVFINIGLGVWDTYNMATGLLGDILSYVRLFALGLSGGILASVFNSLAFGLAPDNVIAGPVVIVLIFVIGHAINIFMNVLGAIVHPMRLTFVEFFKNAGYEGGGKEYKPFQNN